MLILLSFYTHTQIPHQLVGVPLNFNVTLECFTEAHPTSLNYWTREDGNMIHDSKKYRCVDYKKITASFPKKIISLKIQYLEYYMKRKTVTAVTNLQPNGVLSFIHNQAYIHTWNFL